MGRGWDHRSAGSLPTLERAEKAPVFPDWHRGKNEIVTHKTQNDLPLLYIEMDLLFRLINELTAVHGLYTMYKDFPKK